LNENYQRFLYGFGSSGPIVTDQTSAVSLVNDMVLSDLRSKFLVNSIIISPPILTLSALGAYTMKVTVLSALTRGWPDTKMFRNKKDNSIIIFIMI